MSQPGVWRNAESAPKTGEWFLVYGGNQADYELVRWYDASPICGAQFEAKGDGNRTTFTHWMPLPKPPGWRKK